GLGLRSNLADIVHEREGAVIAHVCDIDPAKEQAVRERFGAEARFCSDFESLISDSTLDAVMILSPDWLHAEHAVAAMNAGRDIFLEKPMATTIADCDRILASAKQTGRRLYVGHNMRHMDFILKM